MYNFVYLQHILELSDYTYNNESTFSVWQTSRGGEFYRQGWRQKGIKKLSQPWNKYDTRIAKTMGQIVFGKKRLWIKREYGIVWQKQKNYQNEDFNNHHNLFNELNKNGEKFANSLNK